jgi:hypothetical protein
MGLGLKGTPPTPLEAIFLCGFAVLDAAAAAFFAVSAREAATSVTEIKSEWRPPSLTLAAPPQIKPPTADQETLTRPIFSKTRHPFVTQAVKGEKSKVAGADAPTLPTGLALRAIVKLGGAKARIFVISKSLGDGKWLGVGDAIEGWSVEAIQPLNVVLRNGDHIAQVPFDYSDRAPANGVGAAHALIEALPKGVPRDSGALKPVNAIRHGAS